ncbi:alpha-mannosidase [Pengzhenrongella frigida]|uniref:Alpha-mannosidase n=1 Tax=Pengzhenrongella frigida TaxID=1259133 RepID=A0A4Q5MXX2_9MICO|nr:alpha-mannosidase [Cellulomonas sp. HLT2-17]RYV50459.1 alpha-mannosidase [Cellulomonas sp. HLT2-17]
MSSNDWVFIPHTHWDREWYEPFQVFRYRLVTELDRLIETAERDREFRFTLDGQTAAIQDYLEMRPENEARVRGLVESGRLALGPWLILLDEFLCTGETIVRNLRLGVEGATALGGAMAVGYLPDMFGHVAQMPQILRRAGIEHAALWRGVPASVTGHSFFWQAPDGSTIRTEYLFDGYDNGLDVLLVPLEIGRALDDYAQATEGRWGDDPILAMAGTDHTVPDPRLGEWLRRAARHDRTIVVATLEEYVSSRPVDPSAPVVHGELRSHARGNILPGVLSVRRSLKQMMAGAERVVDQAERLAAQWSASSPDEFLTVAWRKIIESTAHDSVVGSGTDETSDQVLARLAEAGQIGRAARDGVLDGLAASVPTSGYFVVNPLPNPCDVMAAVHVEMPDDGGALRATTADGSELPIQALTTAPTVLGDETMDASQLDRVLRRIHRRELFGRQIASYSLEPGTLAFRLAEVATEEPFDLLELRSHVASATRARPGSWRVLTTTAPVTSVLVTVPVASSGMTAFSVVSTGGSIPVPCPEQLPGSISNGVLRASVRDDGTLDLADGEGVVLTGLGRLVDGGDRGDSYNFAPPADDLLVDVPTIVTSDVLEEGPARWILRVVRTYAVPLSLASDPDRRSRATGPLVVETLAELRGGEPFLRLTVSFVNVARDHRTRLHLRLPDAVTTSAAEGQFAVTTRGLAGEGGWGEYPIPTYPATSFISAGPVTVLLDHATEYELVDGGRDLAITLLRAVGSMSRNLHPLRDEPAASEIAVPGAQALGETVTGRFAVLPSRAGWHPAKAVLLAERFRSEPLVRRGTASTSTALPAPSTGLRVDGDSVAVSSVHRTAAGVELRIVAMGDSPTIATVTGDFTAATTVTLLGHPISDVTSPGRLEIPLMPWEIRSVVLKEGHSS